jgi:hypothetical protein
LFMSSLILIYPTLLHMLVCMESIVSYAARILSVIRRPGIKALYVL